ncbi:MAG: alpha/beta fold hydrolase [Myxococcales bacterium]
MRTKVRSNADDLRGASRLAVEATRGVTDLVEEMHLRIAGGPDLLGRPLRVAVRVFAGPVFGIIRGVTTLVGASLEAALESLAPLIGESAPGPEREAVLAALNGVVGDYLEATGNPLAIPMRLRVDGQPLELAGKALRRALPDASGKVLVFVHGSSTNDLHWARRAQGRRAALARELGCTAIDLHYNTGLHISTNGRGFAELLEELVQEWPVPVDELAIVGHSMGGLVARSACHAASLAGHTWLEQRLRKLVCLGSPHHGTLLERAGNLVGAAMGVSSYSAAFARLGKLRSAGITDLRYGSVRDEDWDGHDRFALGADRRQPVPLPEGVECFAAAASTTRNPGPRRRSGGRRGAEPMSGGRLRGDGLVSVDSALGRHRKAELTLAFPRAHQWVGLGMSHLDLLSSPELYDVLRRWLGS